MKVFVVCMGENGEGGDVEGLFQTIESARKAAKKIIDRSTFTDWKENLPDHWVGGCDWVRIDEMEIQP